MKQTIFKGNIKKNCTSTLVDKATKFQVVLFHELRVNFVYVLKRVKFLLQS